MTSEQKRVDLTIKVLTFEKIALCEEIYESIYDTIINEGGGEWELTELMHEMIDYTNSGIAFHHKKELQQVIDYFLLPINLQLDKQQD